MPLPCQQADESVARNEVTAEPSGDFIVYLGLPRRKMTMPKMNAAVGTQKDTKKPNSFGMPSSGKPCSAMFVRKR